MSRKMNNHYDKIGMASWYGDEFHGRYTANGEIFDENSISAASPTLPLPSYARVTNLQTTARSWCASTTAGPMRPIG